MIIVGSTALKYFDITSKAKDLDIWGTNPIDVVGIDYCQMPREILDLIPTLNNHATPAAILTIKMSHLSWDIKWDKTKRHILLLKSLGYKVIPELYTILKKHWETVHGDKTFLSLSKNKTEFFNDYVDYKYDHDYLHELVAFPCEPVYNRSLKQGEDVLVCKDKFFSMSLEDQIKMFREEITVIAIERWLVHNSYTGSWYTAYIEALKKTITNLTKNWANDFIIDNLEKFVKPEYKYFKHAMKTLEELKMSTVDLTPFNEILATQTKNEYSLDELIYSMCEGDFSFDGIEYPTEGDWKERREKFDKLTAEAGYEHLEQEGGGEGGSEYCYGIFKLHDKIYKAEYSYYSHNGHEYYGIKDTLQEVKPVQKTITVYE